MPILGKKIYVLDSRRSDAPDLMADPSLYPGCQYSEGEVEKRRRMAKRQLKRAGKLVVYNSPLGHRCFWVKSPEGFLPQDVQVSGHFRLTGAVQFPLYVRANRPHEGSLGTLHPGHNLEVINTNINEVRSVSRDDVSQRYGGAAVVDVYINRRP